MTTSTHGYHPFYPIDNRQGCSRAESVVRRTDLPKKQFLNIFRGHLKLRPCELESRITVSWPLRWPAERYYGTRALVTRPRRRTFHVTIERPVALMRIVRLRLVNLVQVSGCTNDIGLHRRDHTRRLIHNYHRDSSGIYGRTNCFVFGWRINRWVKKKKSINKRRPELY